MIDVNQPLRKAYFEALSALIYAGNPLPVYDSIVPDTVVKGETFFYVILGNQTDNDAPRTKGCIVHDASILINIYYGSMAGGGQKTGDDIEALIAGAVYDVSNGAVMDLSSSSLQIVTTEKVGDNTQFLPGDTHKVWVRSIRFRHKIVES